jgi:hypothetical protein
MLSKGKRVIMKNEEMQIMVQVCKKVLATTPTQIASNNMLIAHFFVLTAIGDHSADNFKQDDNPPVQHLTLSLHRQYMSKQLDATPLYLFQLQISL